MRLLVVSHSYVLGNTRGKIRALGRFAEVSLLVPKAWSFELGRAIAEPEADSSIDLYKSSVVFDGRNIRFFYNPRTVWRVTRKVRPHVVLVEQEPNSLAMLQFSLLKKVLGYRLFFFSWENIGSHRPLTRWIERTNLRRASGAIAGNRDAVEVLRKKGFRGPIELIPQMGINPSEFFPGEPPPERPFVLAYVGRIAEEKGLRVLFQALKNLTADWRMRLIGEGPLKSELTAMAHALGFGSRLTWQGYLPREKLPGHLRQAHALVLPSVTTTRLKEQFGLVLVEGMACGVPVVGSSCGAIPEVLGDAGLIFPEGDPDALRRCLEELMNDAPLRKRLVDRGRARVLAHFTDDVIAKANRRFILSDSPSFGAV